jgi:hypothetical protein
VDETVLPWRRKWRRGWSWLFFRERRGGRGVLAPGLKSIEGKDVEGKEEGNGGEGRKGEVLRVVREEVWKVGEGR